MKGKGERKKEKREGNEEKGEKKTTKKEEKKEEQVAKNDTCSYQLIIDNKDHLFLQDV